MLPPPPPLIHTKYRITLTDCERAALTRLVSTGRTATRVIAHAHVLRKAVASATGPAWTDEQILTAVGLGLSTIARIRRRFVEQGADTARYRQPFRTLRPRKLDGRAGAPSSPWPAAPRPRAAPVGPSRCSPTTSSPAASLPRSPMKPCAGC